jgi:hypothetical protein
LEWGVVAGEHAAIVVARVVDEAAGLLRSRGEALAGDLGHDNGVHSWVAHFLVGPAGAISEALGFDALDATGEHADDGSEDRCRLHFAFGLVGLCFTADRLVKSVEDDRGKRHCKAEPEASFVCAGYYFDVVANERAAHKEGYLGIMFSCSQDCSVPTSALKVMYRFSSFELVHTRFVLWAEYSYALLQVHGCDYMRI